jgi:hypothetical protein
VTAQTPDRLDYQGKTYSVYEFIDLPPGVVPPPAAILVQDTACWRGFTCRWEIREQDGRPQLYMIGFQCEEYLPLCSPYFNPITGTVRVVPKDAECLHYEHMGFQSKHAGELRLRFIAGELLGLEPIPDEEAPQDGLLDLAELAPGGKEAWLEKVGQRQQGRAPVRVPPDVPEKLNRDEFASRENLPCAACGAVMVVAPAMMRDPICGTCSERLLAIGRWLPHWHAVPSGFGGAVRLSSRANREDDSPRDPEWHARSGLDPFGSLEFEANNVAVRIRIRGRKWLRSRIAIEVAGKEKARQKHRSSVLRAVSRRLAKCLQAEGGTWVRASYRSGITVSVGCEVVVTAATQRDDEPVPDEEIAAALLEKLEAAIDRWHLDLATIDRMLHQEVPAQVAKMTSKADVATPGMHTPTDREILDWATRRGEPGARERVWAVLPRHTPDGWLPGETVQERYLKGLNL